jgi:hypothetical protein
VRRARGETGGLDAGAETLTGAVAGTDAGRCFTFLALSLPIKPLGAGLPGGAVVGASSHAGIPPFFAAAGATGSTKATETLAAAAAMATRKRRDDDRFGISRTTRKAPCVPSVNVTGGRFVEPNTPGHECSTTR